MQQRRKAAGCLSRVMKAQTDGAALFIQQTTKPVRWLDRSNGNTGERRRSTARRCRWSLGANLPFKQRRRVERLPPQLHRRRRAILVVRVQTQTQLLWQPSRVSHEIYIPTPSPRLQRIFLLRRRLVAELPALPEASDGWQSNADSEPHRPGDATRNTAHGWGTRRRTGDAPAVWWAQALCIHYRWLTASSELSHCKVLWQALEWRIKLRIHWYAAHWWKNIILNINAINVRKENKYTNSFHHCNVHIFYG